MSEEHLQDFFAAAIRYTPDNDPDVVARGNGPLARQIEATAREHGIPVLQDFTLSRQLAEIPLGNEIPETLYFAIAKLFGYLLEAEEQCCKD